MKDTSVDGVKGFLQSRVIWGAIIALVGLVLQRFGYEFTAADQTQAVETIALVMQGLGPVYAIYGRIKATKTVTTAPVVPAK